MGTVPRVSLLHTVAAVGLEPPGGMPGACRERVQRSPALLQSLTEHGCARGAAAGRCGVAP